MTRNKQLDAWRLEAKRLFADADAAKAMLE